MDGSRFSDYKVKILWLQSRYRTEYFSMAVSFTFDSIFMSKDQRFCIILSFKARGKLQILTTSGGLPLQGKRNLSTTLKVRKQEQVGLL